MPELDPDLVNLLTLGLLGLIVICLLALMSSVGRVRKAIENAAAQREREARWETAAPLAAAETTPAQAAAAEPEPAIERSPQPVAAAREEEPAPAQLREASVSDSDTAPAAETGTHSGGTSELAGSTSVAQSSAASSSASVATEAASEPQEQPFERDGRWWFRRGSELLVYDEGTGQWLTAPEEQRPSTTETQPIPTTISNVAGGHSVQESVSSEQHGFWKCPSCGAVNGSTATSCRMCFTARP